MALEAMEELPRSYPHPPPSPAPLSPAASPAPHSWRFEVFLSFSGQDTRGNFTDHLLSGLLERQVKAYRDDKNLPRGSFISKALLRAIERSRISIIIFSKNYAASRWCLDELVKIVKCRKLLGHIILPVFFDVRPDHVAKQTGPYKKIFRKYEEKYKDNKQKVEKWKDALKTVAEISGWDKENYRSESKLIRIIAKKVLRKLRKAAPTVGNQLVQLNSKAEEMKLKLYEKWEEIGTIKFYGLQWGRKIWDSPKEKKRWQSQQVHVLVDEVDKLEQLVNFARKQDWFGPGSRVIISVGDPNKNNMSVLHINYEGSINRDKNIFLDVVCFFKELNNENAMRIKKLLFDVPADKVLVDDFTITVEDNDNLLIHGHGSFNILEIDYEVSPKKTKPNEATKKVEPLPNGHPPTPVSNPQLEVEDAVPKEDFPQQEKHKVPPSLMEKQEKLVPNGILKAPKVELLRQEVHNEAAMVKPEMELAAQAEEDNSEDTKDTLQKKKQELGDYFNMSLEEIHQANAFNNIEKIVSTLTHNSANLYEKANLQKLMDRFTEFKGSVPDSVTTAERTQAHSISLLMKSRKLKQSLAHVQEQLRSSEAELSKISKEKEELDIQIQSLISRKEKLIEHKKSTEFQLETTKKTVSTNLSEQKMIDGEIEQAYENWFKAKEKLVLANASWKLFKECIEL